jgi:hypothetical protein
VFISIPPSDSVAGVSKTVLARLNADFERGMVALCLCVFVSLCLCV